MCSTCQKKATRHDYKYFNNTLCTILLVNIDRTLLLRTHD
jgi:hypothetical protein